MKVEIRAANIQDIDWLIGQLRKFSKFFGTKKSLFGDEEFARQALPGLMENHLFLIADAKDIGPVGFITGVITPHLLNPQIRLLAEIFWWVQEEHRGSRAGLMLLNEFVKYGKENCDWITFAIESHSPVSTKHLEKRGFQLQEHSYLMEVA